MKPIWMVYAHHQNCLCQDVMGLFAHEVDAKAARDRWQENAGNMAKLLVTQTGIHSRALGAPKEES